MKYVVCLTASMILLILGAFAAPVQPHHLLARPIESVMVTKSDRAFLGDVAAEMLLQRMAAERLLEFTENQYFIESARFTLKTLDEIQADLDELARARRIALPLAGSVEKPREFERFLNSRNGAFEREYQRYAQRGMERLADRFERTAEKADDPEVRCFSMRHARWVEFAHHETKGLIPANADLAGRPATRTVSSGRVAEIFEPPTSVPLVAAESPISPGGAR
jgi:hypothetical protein